MTETPRKEILLESGTNEMEVIEFYLGDQSFGINVQKLREIIPYDEEKTNALPEGAASIVGTFLVRGHTIPLVNLGLHLRRLSAPATDIRQVVMVCEFNNRTNGFLVDGVNMIHRVSWSDVSPMATYIDQHHPRFTGSINIEGREILVVDLEHIVAEIDPSSRLKYDKADELPSGQVEKPLTERQKIRLFMAEDSGIIRAGMERVLQDAGYTQIRSFVNGEDCFLEIQNMVNAAKASGTFPRIDLDLLISDIEMPQMDGLTLCRRVRDELGLKDLPIVMFSSLINEQMRIKCDSVGANECISKPQIPELVNIVDQYCASSL